MTLEGCGLFVLAVGAVLLILGLFASGPPSGLNGMRMAGSSTKHALGWSSYMTGSLLVLAGSVLTAWAERPTTILVLSTAAAVVGLLAAGFFYAKRSGSVTDPRRLTKKRTWAGIGLFLVAIVVFAVAGVELLDKGFREWTVERPVAVGVFLAIVTAAAVTLGLETVLRQRAQKRWWPSACRSAEAFLAKADTFHRELTPVVLAEIGEQIRSGTSYENALRLLAQDEPVFFSPELQTKLDGAAQGIAEFATIVTGTLIRFNDRADLADEFWSIQEKMLGIVMDIRLIQSQAASNDPGVVAFRGDHGCAIAQKHREIQHAIQDLALKFEIERFDNDEPFLRGA